MNKHKYYVSECPDTGRQFLCEVGVDGNIAELTPSTVAHLLVAHRRMREVESCLEKTKRLFKEAKLEEK